MRLVYICTGDDDAYEWISCNFRKAYAQTERLCLNDLNDIIKLSKGDLLVLDFRPDFDRWAYTDDWKKEDKDRYILSNIKQALSIQCTKLPIIVLANGGDIFTRYSKLKRDFDIVLDVVTESMLEPDLVSALFECEEISLPKGKYTLLIDMYKDYRVELRSESYTMDTEYDDIHMPPNADIIINRNNLEGWFRKKRDGYYQSMCIPDIREAGEDLFRIIFADDSAPMERYKFCRQKICPQDLSLEFRVEEDNPFPFELLYDPSVGFVSIIHKSYRSLTGRFSVKNSETAEERIHNMKVLLIASETGFQAEGPDGELMELGWVANHVADEIQRIQEIMEAAGVKKENIVVLPSNDIEATSAEVLKTIAGNEWHIIHFAGHSTRHIISEKACEDPKCSHHELNKESGQIVFRHSRPPECNPFYGDSTCLWRILRKCRESSFIYFSSCRSGLDAILIQTVMNVADSALGFLWGVDDSKASCFAAFFYQRLFDCLKNGSDSPIAEAVWGTQKELSVPGLDIDSLAPVLISQHSGDF